MTNKELIQTELNKVKREGMDKLLKFLEADHTDFYTAPASTRFHLCEEGGLAQHSLNVLKFGRLIDKELSLDLPEESIILTCLLHDLCKVNFYVRGWEWDKEIKEKENIWQKKDCWKVDDQIPLGHGEKSVILIVRYIELTTAEMAAVRWHMMDSEPGVNFNYPTGLPYRASLDKFPLVKLVALADRMAELYESMEKKGTKRLPGL